MTQVWNCKAEAEKSQLDKIGSDKTPWSFSSSFIRIQCEDSSCMIKKECKGKLNGVSQKRPEESSSIVKKSYRCQLNLAFKRALANLKTALEQHWETKKCKLSAPSI